jgi:broad specificity phosphatase PhoE
MGLITIVRHGQASTFAKDYDRLTDLGHVQARRLGEYWANMGVSWDRVLIGPRLRHRQTAECVGEVYQERSLGWPAAEVVQDLDELPFSKIVAHLQGERAEPGRESMSLAEVPEHERPQVLRAMFRRVKVLTGRYARERLDVPEAESWDEFGERAQRALDYMANSGPGQRVVAFSSGGISGRVISRVLGLDEERTVDLMLRLRNSSYTSIIYSPSSRSLLSLNAVPHLTPEMWTVG